MGRRVWDKYGKIEIILKPITDSDRKRNYLNSFGRNCFKSNKKSDQIFIRLCFTLKGFYEILHGPDEL